MSAVACDTLRCSVKTEASTVRTRQEELQQYSAALEDAGIGETRRLDELDAKTGKERKRAR